MPQLFVSQVRWALSRLVVLVLAMLPLVSGSALPARARSQPLLAYPAAAGSTSPDGLLQVTSRGHVLGFQAGGYYLSNGAYALSVQFVDANPVTPTRETPSPAHGVGVPPSDRVTYGNLWDGIMLAYDTSHGGLVSSAYRLEPQANAHNIHLRYNAPVTFNSDGTLTISYATGRLTESAPEAWQEVAGERVPVRVAFESRGEREVGFEVGAYDTRHSLFIDPTLTWNTFLGGSGDDYNFDLALDANGNIIVAGTSTATWGSPVRAYSGSHDAFAAKLNSSGELLWNTFLGGTGSDWGNAVAVDGSGNIYIAGWSDSAWQSTNPPVRAFTAGTDAFVAKLNPTGTLLWNTFLGASGSDVGIDIAADGNGDTYLAGNSDATWQGSSPPVRGFTEGARDAFAAKLNSSGQLLWNTFLGGTGADYGRGIAVNGTGDIFMTGWSEGAWQDTNPPVRAFTAGPDAFAAKLTPDGRLLWNTFLGGDGSDRAYAVAVDRNGNVYVTGMSTATWESPIRAFAGGNYDTFAAKLDSSGALTWSTFLGGVGDDYVWAIATDAGGNIYVAGESNTTWGAPARPYTGQFDAYAAKLSSSGALLWNTFLGASGADGGKAIALDGNGNAYVAGLSTVTWGSPVRPYTGGSDAFVAKLGTFDFNLDLPLILK